jgi:hypothetical protein
LSGKRSPLAFCALLSHFDMRLGGLVTTFAAAMAAVVWAPKILARRKSASE